MSLAACEERCARLRTSEATTAKPRPASPARAASTAALSARRLVWRAISSITPMMSEILREDSSILRHRVDRLRHHLAAAVGDVARAAGQLVGLQGVVGVLLHGRGHLLHRGGGLLEARGLLLGALRQVGGAGGDLGRRIGDLAGRAGDPGDGLLQLLDRAVEVVLDALITHGEAGPETHREIAFGELGEAVGQGRDRGRLLLRGERLRLRVQPALLLDARTLLVGQLALLGGLRLERGLRDRGIPEHHDRLRHLADLVLAFSSLARRCRIRPWQARSWSRPGRRSDA